ncbi:FliM/FliN family flagellar motor switch protein [Sphingomonas adhaesiva]|uniref:FliM/FliN family flagellar motor switch protein n=1 Tax=Sphingomonas adhaesiva TaxID=28212 RepID=UPI002FFBEABA
MSMDDDAPAVRGMVGRSVLDGLPVTVEALLGVAKVTVGDLSRLTEDQVFALDASLGDPVELRLNGVAIAQGELVAMGDRFAVRIRQVSAD